ncbi:hypothetical protein KOW79_020245 [Hemibagrus wyckioides]|uniref:Uncharacterized protein n=1 Tax=Hemibagrus wyckioides TaxID=337641 RepID=A0A9D3N692_9TELE|nr:hypothetical protein KOW79_020245 [Hemibagrus wyckioides]
MGSSGNKQRNQRQRQRRQVNKRLADGDLAAAEQVQLASPAKRAAEPRVYEAEPADQRTQQRRRSWLAAANQRQRRQQRQPATAAGERVKRSSEQQPAPSRLQQRATASRRQ